MSTPALQLPAEVLGIHHVQLTYPASQHMQVHHFYRDVLGLSCCSPVVTGDGQGQVCSYAAGALRLDLVASWAADRPRSTPHGAGGLGHVALQVQGIAALHQRLLNQQCNPLAVVQVREGLRFYVKDPAGNTLELVQPMPAAALQPPIAACRNPSIPTPLSHELPATAIGA